MNWQPIETAPKNRTEILVLYKHSPTCEPLISIARWGFCDYNADQEHYQDFTENGGEEWVLVESLDSEQGTFITVGAIMWMPLPEIPKECFESSCYVKQRWEE